MEGSDFNVQMKIKRQDATADCNAYCDPVIYDWVNRTAGEKYWWDILNASHISVSISQRNKNGRYTDCFRGTVFPAQEGRVTLWNTEDGIPDYSDRMYSLGGPSNTILHWFHSEVTIHSCQGESYPYTSVFLVASHDKRNRSSDSEDGGHVLVDENFIHELLLESSQESLLTESAACEGNEEDDHAFSIFPNPTSGAFTITNNTDAPIQKVEVHNSAG